MKKHLQERRNESGFTLIELLIVIIILGVLAAIVVFAIGSTRDDAVSSACKTDLKSMELSAEAYNTKSGDYPAAEADLTDTDEGGLLKTLPESDDYSFTYTQTGGGDGYTITVQDKDGDTVADCDAL